MAVMTRDDDNPMTDTIQARLRAWALQPETDGDGNRVPMGFCDECSSLRAHREHCPRADVLALLDAAPQVGTCAWTENEDGQWETSCGGSWEFMSDGPTENKVLFCHRCGLVCVPVRRLLTEEGLTP